MSLKTISLYILCLFALPLVAAEKLSVLILDGRNNHDWEVTTDAVRATLLSSGRFTVSVASAPELKAHEQPRLPRNADAAVKARYEAALARYQKATAAAKERLKTDWADWQPDFKRYDTVVLNYNGPDWPAPMKAAFVDYVQQGGGVVLIHAANNAFRNWPAFNDMIGLGWRGADFGKCLKFDPESGSCRHDATAGASGHGSKHPFQVTVRASDHPIMKDLPPVWLHGKDELYHNMRGTAENMTVLSTAFSDKKTRGTGQHEPITWEVAYGKGRVIVTSMGHFWHGQTNWDGLHCVGFQTIVARSSEYVATGSVTLPVPAKFPSADTASVSLPHTLDWKQAQQASSKNSWKAKKEQDPYCMLNPEEERGTFDLAEGFVADLAAAEPQVQEPVLTVWDGNGVMYVAEMRSYMQDKDGSGTKTLKNGRIKRLEDIDGDGRIDRVSIFVDGLNLPRAILPLDDRIAVRETDSTRVTAYRDTDGDGVADQTEVLFEGTSEGRNGPRTSVEHQDSGLIWNLDNWIYVSYNAERYRFTDEKWAAQKQPGHWTQWGLTYDDTGHLFWVDNSRPVKSLQIHPKYWQTVHRKASRGINGLPINLGLPYAPDFMQVKSTCLLNDRGGPASEIRGFTSACGQTVFRGDKLPFDYRGDYFVVDPTIHVLRRAKITRPEGKLFLEKAEPGDEEFLRSSDINCRFVNTATGPDGCLYVTDMYRGIIQDSPWMNPKARAFTEASGLANNNQHGRIWRIRHRDFAPRRAPRMLEETTVELLRHLGHANGWWRDTAQRMIVLRPDRETVVPLLRDMVFYSQNTMARLHALWTLEGISGGDPESVVWASRDRDPRVRAAAIKIGEQLLEKPPIFEALAAMAEDRDPEVAKQLILSLGTLDDERAIRAIQTAARRHMNHKGVMLATAIGLWGMRDEALVQDVHSGKAFQRVPADQRSTAAANWVAALANWERGLNFPKEMSKDDQRVLRSGETLFFKHCVTCHGADGKGMAVLGTDQLLAPPLAGSPRVTGKSEHLIPILLHGLVGPLDGKSYQAGFMPPATALGITRNDRLAELLSYIRFAWGNEQSIITKDQVKRLRNSLNKRKTPWQQAELEAFNGQPEKP